MKRTRLLSSALLLLQLAIAHSLFAKNQSSSSAPQQVTVAEFLTAVHARAKTLEKSSGMRSAFQSFTAAHHLAPESIRYSDFVLIRLFFEATRDAGFWNLHWQISDQPPNSDRIWRQWAKVDRPSFFKPTATAECDELSALYAFLVARSGVKTVGLFWPAPNHTVAVWVLKPASAPAIRVVIPTSQIFLEETDSFDTRKFDPWKQKTIYEYTRRDVPDSFDIPAPLANFFLAQIDKYAGASDTTLQHLRYVRDAVLTNYWSPNQAARDALARRAALSPSIPEDSAALQFFATDVSMQSSRR